MLKLLGSNSIEIGLPVPLETIDVYWQWRQVAAQFLSFAFLHRSACLITVSPQRWSLGQELKANSEIVVDHKPYLLTFIDSCSAELLAEVSESEDFERGLLWLIALNENHKAEMIETIRAVTTSDSLLSVPQIDQELMRSAGDGSAIHWLNPYKSLHDIASAAAKLAQFPGWDFDTITIDPLVNKYEE
ncbi:hypothetical protein IQ268_08235 [Oculatella sp. LEGE 06141]|uniref:hypothetical protein n=1 Tax=Oculatella sp. LEGE 06141 TaxID=1828648 RepID=UPI00187DE988|nr:hypothetical protein [Oculatella sp. LEGE 06141]MBE9178545.1 hypothetical protein [Oculatella sp. LEGE 06141]